MSDDSQLADGEEHLSEQKELLWRNAHPTWIVDGELTSQAFRPTPKDQQKLSTAREDKVSAEDSFKEFTETFEFESVGVWAVSVGDVKKQGLRSIYDESSPSTPKPCLKGHTSIDFTSVSNNQAKRIGGRLRDRAETRGRQHPPLDESDSAAW